MGIAEKDKWIIQFVYRSINHSCGKPFWIDICFTWDLFATHLKKNNVSTALALLPGGVLPIEGCKRRLLPKGVSFLLLQYTKG